MRVAGAVAPDSAQGATTEAGFTVGEITLGGTVGLVTFVGVLVGIVGVVTVERSSGDPIVKLPGIRRSRFLP